MTGTGGAGNIGSLTLSAERGIFFHDSRRNSGAKQRRRPGFCPISPCCPSAPGIDTIDSMILSYFFLVFFTTCAFVWRGRLEYATLCDAFIFLCRTNPWMKYPRNSIFFNFERMIYWYEIKAYFLKNLFLSYFFRLFFGREKTAS